MEKKKKFQTVEDVPVWQKSHELTLLIYKLTKEYPRDELYGLISQIKRSSSSIPANITEGFYKNTTKELIQFLFNARGSCGETIYHLKLSFDLKYIKEKDYLFLRKEYENVNMQLNSWMKSLRSRI